jgi:hypothetical protein
MPATLQMPFLFQALQFQEPVRVRAELQETDPAHADMLRYDLAFHSPVDPSLVIFPWFKHKTQGAYPKTITAARWQSFAMNLKAQDEEQVYLATRDFPLGDWIGYQHPDGNQCGLVPVTLDQWLQAHPQVRINGWRRL